MHNEAISNYIYFLPVWEDNPTSDYVYQFLARLLENQDPVVMNNDDYLIIAFHNIIANTSTDIISDTTLERLFIAIRKISQNPTHAEVLQIAMNEEEESRLKQFLRLYNQSN